ncbi:Flagellar hook-length control protein FliK [Planctomycetes bacterium Pan216]|uniref:Flagellar hook-length control protein FliK n=1 Tax=Kolteria novifilia TaxID=2527975 RepID=A0A518B6H6_9BACT|nr:Flagellar hook-length control protein FliK [Planctomycetes bacterium Pan216]
MKQLPLLTAIPFLKKSLETIDAPQAGDNALGEAFLAAFRAAAEAGMPQHAALATTMSQSLMTVPSEVQEIEGLLEMLGVDPSKAESMLGDLALLDAQPETLSASLKVSPDELLASLSLLSDDVEFPEAVDEFDDPLPSLEEDLPTVKEDSVSGQEPTESSPKPSASSDLARLVHEQTVKNDPETIGERALESDQPSAVVERSPTQEPIGTASAIAAHPDMELLRRVAPKQVVDKVLASVRRDSARPLTRPTKFEEPVVDLPEDVAGKLLARSDQVAPLIPEVAANVEQASPATKPTTDLSSTVVLASAEDLVDEGSEGLALKAEARPSVVEIPQPLAPGSAPGVDLGGAIRPIAVPLKDIERLLAKQTPPVALEELIRSETAAQAEGSTVEDRNASALAKTDRAEFVQRISEALQRANLQSPKKIEVDLHPPALGKLRLQVINEGGQLHARIETHSAAIRTLLTEHLATLDRHMTDQGLTLQKVNVEHVPPPPESAADEHPLHDGRENHDQPPQQGEQGKRDHEEVAEEAIEESSPNRSRAVSIGDLLSLATGMDRTI